MEISRLASWLVGLLAASLIITIMFDLCDEVTGLQQAEETLQQNFNYEDNEYNNIDKNKENSDTPHVRKKRLLWITTDGRLALPPGTHLTITPSLSLPFVRYPPDGFLSNMSISLPFSIDFDMLGLTDNQNPYGVLPPLLGRSLGRQAGSYFADYVAQFLESKRTARSIPPSTKHPKFHGGERALLYTVVEDLLASFGMDGKACLLRAICEVHSHSSMQKFGLVGEIIQLFFSASKSPFAELLNEYVTAEVTGREKKECWPYFKDCPKSLFRSIHNKYTEDSSKSEFEEDETLNEINVDDDEDQETVDSTITIDNNRKNTLAM